MGRTHYFFIDDLSIFIAHLESKKYSCSRQLEEAGVRVNYSKVLSDAVVKYYSYDEWEAAVAPVRISVTYGLLNAGKTLARLARKLKSLNSRYRLALPEWKTKRKVSEETRDRRGDAVQKFLREHGELISCFKYEGDNRLTEGNHSFNLEVAATPREQTICFQFIKALVDAYEPQGIVRARRGPDKPSQQRNGWIKRYALLHKKKGWSPLEISKEIQRELREGTWNERSRLQYNLAQNTILRIAGMKPPHAAFIN